jgi:hypothetical protein
MKTVRERLSLRLVRLSWAINRYESRSQTVFVEAGATELAPARIAGRAGGHRCLAPHRWRRRRAQACVNGRVHLSAVCGAAIYVCTADCRARASAPAPFVLRVFALSPVRISTHSQHQADRPPPPPACPRPRRRPARRVSASCHSLPEHRASGSVRDFLQWRVHMNVTAQPGLCAGGMAHRRGTFWKWTRETVCAGPAPGIVCIEAAARAIYFATGVVFKQGEIKGRNCA